MTKHFSVPSVKNDGISAGLLNWNYWVIPRTATISQLR